MVRLIRVLAVTSGRTVYDLAIVNTAIDQKQARFDPHLDGKTCDRNELPIAFPQPATPQDRHEGLRTDNYGMDLGLDKNPLQAGNSRRRQYAPLAVSSPASSP